MVLKNGNPKSHQQYKHFIPPDLLDDLCCRFIINLPPDDRWDLVRVCFHVEMAHWFYLDYYCEMYNLKPCGQRMFAVHIFHHIPCLHRHIVDLDSVLANWREYKRSIPTYGAILLDEDLSHILLVQSFSAKASWGFPKGKVNEDEEPWICAVREVLEETGFDISKRLNKREYINATVNGQTIRLYIITNVPRDTNFKPLTRNEIKSCEWFPINELPSNNKDMKTPKVKTRVSHDTFLLVKPFLKKLRRWVYDKNRNESTRDSRQHSMNATEFSTTKTEIGISHELNAVANYQEQNFSTPELQDAFRKYQQKNFPTHGPQNNLQYQDQDCSTEELQIAYKKYLQHNQPFDKLLNMAMKNQQQNLPYYKYQDGQLYQVQKSPMTANNSHILSTNTRANNLSNLDKYYHQDIPTQQLKNALMMYDQQDFPHLEIKQSQQYEEQCSPNNSHSWSKTTSDNNLSINDRNLATGRKLLTPSDFRSTNALQKKLSSGEYYTRVSNFVAPSWADFKFNRKAILDSMT